MTGGDIAAALRQAGRGVLVLVVEAKGSAPAEAGAAMLVTESATHGTVGGGAVEHRAIQAARELLAGAPSPKPSPAREEEAHADVPARPGEIRHDAHAQPLDHVSLEPATAAERETQARRAPPLPSRERVGVRGRDEGPAGAGLHLLDFPLGPALDQCCGGRLRLALTPLAAADAPRFEAGEPASFAEGVVWRPAPPPRPVLVYGAGHVGRALVAALAPLPFRLRWIDARAGLMADAPPGVETFETPLPEAEAAAAPPEATHLVVTHSHALDLEIVAAALSRESAMVGLIGSATKRATFVRRLEERGLAAAARARLVCPIGLPGLKDRRPAVIAAFVAADLLQRDAALRGVQRGAA